MTFDDNGWWVGEVAPFALDESYSLFAPEVASVLHAERIRHQAQRFFRIDLTLTTAKLYPSGGQPRFDRATFRVVRATTIRHVEVVTLPIDAAPTALAAARGAGARVGAGMDVLVERTVRLWQISALAPEDPFPLAVATVMASLLLAPVLPPEGNDLLGVKSARARLERLGWPT